MGDTVYGSDDNPVRTVQSVDVGDATISTGPLAAPPKIQRRGRIFVNYLRNQRGATAVMPYAVRARSGSPVAVPITRKEMETIDSAAHWHVDDAKELVHRAGSKALSG